jgi:hypothetical protein
MQYRILLIVVAFIGIVALAAGLTTGLLTIINIAIAAVFYPLVLVVTGAQAAQKAFEVHEEGVWGTRRQGLLLFRRFVRWPEIARGEARLLLLGRTHLKLLLLDGSVVFSIPGELSPEAIHYIDEHAGHQIRWVGQRPTAIV